MKIKIQYLIVIMLLEAVFFIHVINSLPATKTPLPCSEANKMTRLVAYINNDRSQESVEQKIQNYKAEFSRRVFPEEIIVSSIETQQRIGSLSDVKYYIYNEKLRIGVLANGAVFTGEFVAERFQDYIHTYDPCYIWE